MKQTVARLSRLKQIVVFGLVYITLFLLMEQRAVPVHIIHVPLDDMIPFCEYFIIPYLLWFLFVGGTVLGFGLFCPREEEYYRLVNALAIGMGLFLLVSFLYPNGQDLRPVLTRDNFCTRLVAMLYQGDTSTNILPSLHVYNSVVCFVALWKNAWCRSHRGLMAVMGLLTVSIILATMFLKQHSVVDVAAALLLNLVVTPLVYDKLAARGPMALAEYKHRRRESV